MCDSSLALRTGAQDWHYTQVLQRPHPSGKQRSKLRSSNTDFLKDLFRAAELIRHQCSRVETWTNLKSWTVLLLVLDFNASNQRLKTCLSEYMNYECDHCSDDWDISLTIRSQVLKLLTNRSIETLLQLFGHFGSHQWIRINTFEPFVGNVFSDKRYLDKCSTVGLLWATEGKACLRWSL